MTPSSLSSKDRRRTDDTETVRTNSVIYPWLASGQIANLASVSPHSGMPS
jgi:hypothetical protein